MSENIISEDKILRFRKSERLLHWAIAIPFTICYFSALVLVLYYNPDPSRPFRIVFSWTHRIAGICMAIFPIIAILISKNDLKVYVFNIKHSLAWTREDFRWLFLMGFAAVNKRVSLPDQGKFNAAEKLHFISLIITYPLYMVTGILIWYTNSALLPWFIHFTMALIATTFMLSHIFMATLNPSTRIALSGMTSGFVDRHYVKHHHASWYKEKFEGNGNTEAVHEEEEEAEVGAQQEVKSEL